MRLRIPTWLFGAASAASALATVYVFLSAITTASGRFHYCGPTSLDHIDPRCRGGTQFLLLSYALGAMTLLLAALTVWVSWRRRKVSGS